MNTAIQKLGLPIGIAICSLSSVFTVAYMMDETHKQQIKMLKQNYSSKVVCQTCVRKVSVEK